MNIITLALAAEKLAAGGVSAAVVPVPQNCLNIRDKAANCDLCIQTCPVAAITLEPDIQVDPDTCINCGLCLHDCPTGVFQGDDGAQRLLHCALQLADREVIELACKYHPAPKEGKHRVDGVLITDNCLSALGVSAYQGLFAAGVKKLIVRLDNCAECSMGALRGKIETTLDQAAQFDGFDGRTLIKETEKPSGRLKARPVYSIKHPPISRRALLRKVTMQDDGEAHPLVTAFQPLDDGSAVPQERRRLLAALRARKQVDSGRLMPERDFTKLRINDVCTACGTCVRVCPTEALGFYESESAFAITFSTADCVNCGICIHLCEARAIERSGTPTVAEALDQSPVTLHTGALKRCQKCHVVFKGEGDYCPTCSFRRKNPFGYRRNPLENHTNNA
ncbi:MAG: putative Fe hydrogenase large subunit [Chloroflexi bacterium OLB15]|nr:MAG: putative Fe hydrogenase large subunit [Chloroflexi bacterium OLB15]